MIVMCGVSTILFRHYIIKYELYIGKILDCMPALSVLPYHALTFGEKPTEQKELGNKWMIKSVNS